MQLHAFFSGHVQGVGFRWTLCAHARQHHLKGCTKNLEDGRVEVYAVGSIKVLEAFLEDIQKHPGHAQIDSVETHFEETEKAFTEFKIVF